MERNRLTIGEVSVPLLSGNLRRGTGNRTIDTSMGRVSCYTPKYNRIAGPVLERAQACADGVEPDLPGRSASCDATMVECLGWRTQRQIDRRFHSWGSVRR